MVKRNGKTVTQMINEDLAKREGREEMVNHPAHYGGADNVYEVIKVLEAWGLTDNAYRFNAIKYLARADKKGATVQDLEKAIWYIKREIEHLEGMKQPGDTEPAPARKLWVVVYGSDRERVVPCSNAPFEGETLAEAMAEAVNTIGNWDAGWVMVPARDRHLGQFEEAE